MAHSRMRDRDVREAIHRKILSEHHGEPDTLVLDELGLQHGSCRVDIAVVNGFLHGYEIKSDSDTLDRLPRQVEVYSQVLDRVTLVVGERHAEKAAGLLPSWWGIKIATRGPRGAIHLETARSISSNPSVDPIAYAQLLWRDEAVNVLRDLGAPEKTLRGSRMTLYKMLAESLPEVQLRMIVRACLKTRGNWRDRSPPK